MELRPANPGHQKSCNCMDSTSPLLLVPGRKMKRVLEKDADGAEPFDCTSLHAVPRAQVLRTRFGKHTLGGKPFSASLMLCLVCPTTALPADYGKRRLHLIFKHIGTGIGRWAQGLKDATPKSFLEFAYVGHRSKPSGKLKHIYRKCWRNQLAQRLPWSHSLRKNINQALARAVRQSPGCVLNVFFARSRKLSRKTDKSCVAL